MKQLENFIEIDGKLLYAAQQLAGYDPFISKALQRHKSSEGDSLSEQTIKLDGLDLVIEFSTSLHYGPLRGREGTRVIYNGEVLIDRAIGSMGHGSNFLNGNSSFVGPEFALLLCSAHELRYRYAKEIYLDLPEKGNYLLLFRNYAVPYLFPQLPSFTSADSFWTRQYFEEKDIECLREKLWETELFTEGERMSISHSRVNGYSYKGWRGRDSIYEICRSHYCLSRTKLKFKGEEIDFNVGL